MFEMLQGRLGVAFETLLKFDLTRYCPTAAPKPHLNMTTIALLSSFPPYLNAESSLLLTQQRSKWAIQMFSKYRLGRF